MQPGTVGRLPAAAAAGTSAAGCEGSEGGGTAAGAAAYVATFQLRSKEEDATISAIGKVRLTKQHAELPQQPCYGTVRVAVTCIFGTSWPPGRCGQGHGASAGRSGVPAAAAGHGRQPATDVAAAAAPAGPTAPAAAAGTTAAAVSTTPAAAAPAAAAAGKAAAAATTAASAAAAERSTACRTA